MGKWTYKKPASDAGKKKKEKPLGVHSPSGVGRDKIPDKKRSQRSDGIRHNGRCLFHFLSREGIFLLAAEDDDLAVAEDFKRGGMLCDVLYVCHNDHHKCNQKK